MPIVAEPAHRRISSIGTTDQLRRNNLSNILGLLHRSGPLSRAELTRMTGLNRSTVGTVVADLAELRMVYEQMPEKGTKAGRPSPVVHIDRRTVAIAVNPEVDAVHVGLVGLGGRVLKHVRVEAADTPSAEQVVRLATAAIADMLSGQDRALRVVGIGVAGLTTCSALGVSAASTRTCLRTRPPSPTSPTWTASTSGFTAIATVRRSMCTTGLGRPAFVPFSGICS